MLDERIVKRIRAAYEQLVDSGEMLPKARLEEVYDRFRQRFGPDVLARLKGTELLETLHDHGNRDSLVYWIEFKNDEEFPDFFGSIAGGSALKFGLYRRRETRAWMTGHSHAQQELSEDEALVIATKHRDELVAGGRFLLSLPTDPATVDYGRVQDELDRVAPTVSGLAWGHKYFSLLAPQVLDDYHAPHYQRFYLVRMLLEPPPRDGRYVRARGFALAARELEMLPTQLGSALNKIFGLPYRYWRLGTTQGDQGLWPAMLSGAYAGIGWYDLPDLSPIPNTSDGKGRVRSLLEQHYPGDTPQVRGRSAQQIFNFLHALHPNDLVVAMQGGTVLGLGRVTGSYYHEEAEQPAFLHRRSVEWLSSDTWKLPEAEGLRTTFTELKNSVNLVAIERALLEPTRPTPGPLVHRAPKVSSREVEQIRLALERKKQVILYGPPGTGKTHHAEIAVRELAARDWYGREWDALDSAQQDAILLGSDGAAPAISTCCFHPAYGYEEFIEGYRPASGPDGALTFELRDGIFKRLCAIAAAHSERSYFLLIDEINRGDIPRIFGELLTVLEGSRRGRPITLPVSGSALVVPPKLYVIGTMNTADRSIALLDAALRRRFAFIELMPDPEVLGNASVEGLPLGPWLRELNRRIVKNLGHDARNLQVGHSYLLSDGKPIQDIDAFRRTLRMDIIPLLEEYCYEDYTTLAAVLGSSFVDHEARRIRESLFEPAQRAELIQALLQPTPDLNASPNAPTTDESEQELAGDDEGEDGDP